MKKVLVKTVLVTELITVIPALTGLLSKVNIHRTVEPI